MACFNDLPEELIDLIIRTLLLCPAHPSANELLQSCPGDLSHIVREWTDEGDEFETLHESVIDKYDFTSHPSFPCLNWHNPPLLPQFLELRLVCRTFADKLTPLLFSHLTFANVASHSRLRKLLALSGSEPSDWRLSSLLPSTLSNSVAKPALADAFACGAAARRAWLCSCVTTLRIDICPGQLGRDWLAVTHGFTPHDRAPAYFDELLLVLAPALAAFPRVSTLHLATTYSGLHLAGVSRARLLAPCFATLCEVVLRARLHELDDLQLGLPYEGGYTSFFADGSQTMQQWDVQANGDGQLGHSPGMWNAAGAVPANGQGLAPQSFNIGLHAAHANGTNGHGPNGDAGVGLGAVSTSSSTIGKGVLRGEQWEGLRSATVKLSDWSGNFAVLNILSRSNHNDNPLTAATGTINSINPTLVS